jgi:hypothetical protein
LSTNAKFCCQFFLRKSFKIITSVPGVDSMILRFLQ